VKRTAKLFHCFGPPGINKKIIFEVIFFYC